MKVVHLCKGTGNGGFIAAWRLHEALLAAGVDSRMVVRERNGRDDLELMGFSDSRIWWLWFRARGFASRILHRVLLGRKALEEFYLQWIPTFIPRTVRKIFQPDILHVHAADDGLWALRELSSWKGPIVWTFHAYRDFSQGYIYLSHRLNKWIEGGGVGSIHDRDERLFAGLNGSLKKRLMSTRHDACIAPSRFVHEAGRISGVFDGSEHYLIRNCVPLDFYRETGRDDWRGALGIAEGTFVVLTGAHSLDYPIKGFDLFVKTVIEQAEAFAAAKVVVVLFGGGRAPQALRDAVRVLELGYLAEDDLRTAYSGSDLLAIPSREDNFPNVIIEALACGLPYVGYDTGGVGDMVRLDGECGEVVRCFDLRAFGDAILRIAEEDEARKSARRKGCRRAVERQCSPEDVANQHKDIYRKLLRASVSATSESESVKG